MNILCSDNNHYGHIENPIDNKKSNTNDNKSDDNNTYLQTYNYRCIFFYNYLGYDHVSIYMAWKGTYLYTIWIWTKMAVQTSWLITSKISGSG